MHPTFVACEYCVDHPHLMQSQVGYQSHRGHNERSEQADVRQRVPKPNGISRKGAKCEFSCCGAVINPVTLQQMGHGFMQGMTSMGKGIFDGVTGLVTQPMKGAKEEGAKGFFKGFGKGIIGIATKPVAGVIDMASKTTEGITSQASSLRGKKAAVPVRCVHSRLLLKMYVQAPSCSFCCHQGCSWVFSQRHCAAPARRLLGYAAGASRVSRLRAMQRAARVSLTPNFRRCSDVSSMIC